MESTKLHDTDIKSEKAILICVEDTRAGISAEDSLNELAELAQTAGAEVMDTLIQKRDSAHPGHYLGKGKLEELKTVIDLHSANTVICDDELSPAQLRNMGRVLEVKIIDRTMLILDIFAARAVSAEGKVQVELAQLRYALSHLTGQGINLSRLAGGIGTRGPGESKLETDRRHIRARISELQSELKEIQVQRGIQRGKRERNNMPVVSLAGYTNAGKSTLMNLLTNAGVLEENKLFATLDTTTRKIKLNSGAEVLLTDTVGFIHKLPHHLVKAFRATLEEMTHADILLHIVDASNPMRAHHMDVVYKTLQNLGCITKPIITIFNKMDKNAELPLPEDKIAEKTVAMSARTGAGCDELQTAIGEVLNNFKKRIIACIPYSEGQLLNLVHKRCDLIRESHTEEGTLVEVYADNEIAERLERYITE